MPQQLMHATQDERDNAGRKCANDNGRDDQLNRAGAERRWRDSECLDEKG
jgi:hypothetical protein